MRDCTQCGKCCLRYGGGFLGCVTDGDIERWEIYRPDVLNYVEAGDMWISPVTHDDMDRCPWLRKLPNQDGYRCRIHDVRPDACHGYPVDVEQMIQDDCEMLEDGDLDKPHEQLMTELERLRNGGTPRLD